GDGSAWLNNPKSLPRKTWFLSSQKAKSSSEFSSRASGRQRKTQNDFPVLLIGRWTLGVRRRASSYVVFNLARVRCPSIYRPWPWHAVPDNDYMNSASLHAIASVAYKEFLHIYRDRRVLLLLLILPPLFTLLFGHAFETSEISDVPAMLINRDNPPRPQRFIDIVLQNKTFRWREASPAITNESNLLANRVQAALVIPQGWSDSLSAGNPKPLPLYLDGSDINTASAAEGAVQKSLADFQMKERDIIVENLPEEVIELGKKLPVQIRKQFVSLMEAWSAESKIL